MSKEFLEATDRLTKAVTLADVAAEAGVSEATIKRARTDPDRRTGSTAVYRSPPKQWPAVVARLARKRADELVALAVELENDPS